jgi:protein tyrosine phosphatase (PTP) superfamily phosphohydrolase (DUF442 family)
MKTFLTYSIIAVCLSFYSINPTLSKSVSDDKHTLDSVQKIEQFTGIYKVGDFYLGKQPDKEIINWLKSEGVELVINLRTEKEIENFTKSSFNEDSLLKSLEIEYFTLPINYPDSYNQMNLQKFINVISEHNGKIFIHCASGGRVKTFFMGYLIETRGYTVNEAMKISNKMDYYFPLSILLEKEIDMTLKE